MDWSNYLSDKKCPSPPYAHLGVMDGEVWGCYDLSKLPKGTKILSLPTPVKKAELSYTNWSSLRHNNEIEAVRLDYVDEERIDILSTLPNLEYISISNDRQPEITALSSLNALRVLVLASLTKVDTLEFLAGLNHLSTLYICDIKNLYDLSPLSELYGLKELFISNGGMSGVGRTVKSMEFLCNLTDLEYLHFGVTVEGRNYDISPILGLHKLRELHLLPRFLKNGAADIIKQRLPQLNW